MQSGSSPQPISQNLPFNKPPRWSVRTLQVEKCWSTLTTCLLQQVQKEEQSSKKSLECSQCSEEEGLLL